MIDSLPGRRDAWLIASIMSGILLVLVVLYLAGTGVDREEPVRLALAGLVPVSGVVFALASGTKLHETLAVRFIFAAPVVLVVAGVSIWISERPTSASVDLPDASAWPSVVRELDRATEVNEPSGSGSHGPGWESHYVALEIGDGSDQQLACRELLRNLRPLGYRVESRSDDACLASGTVGTEGGFILSVFDDARTSPGLDFAPSIWFGRWRERAGRVLVLVVS